MSNVFCFKKDKYGQKKKAHSHPEITKKPRKRQVNGKKRDSKKKMKLSSRIMGESSNCIRLKCFEVISLQDRQTILDKFNQMSCKDQQYALLASIITPMEVRQRRPRKRRKENDLQCYSSQYQLLIVRHFVVKTQICYKAFLSIFNISKSRLERIQVFTTAGK